MKNVMQWYEQKYFLTILTFVSGVYYEMKNKKILKNQNILQKMERLSSPERKERNSIWDIFITWFHDNLKCESIQGHPVTFGVAPDLISEFLPTEFHFEMWPTPASPREYVSNCATPMIKLFVGKYVEATQGLIDIATITIENSDYLHEPNFENYVKQIMKSFVNLGANPEKALMESWKYLYNLTTLGHPDDDVSTCNIAIVFIILLRLIKNPAGAEGTEYKEWKKLFNETKEQNTFYLGMIPLQNFIKFVLKECDFDELVLGSDMGRDEIYETGELQYPNDIETFLKTYYIRDIVQCILDY
jgi:hypothetical protein